MIKKTIKGLCLLLLMLLVIQINAQEEASPFRKGLWLTTLDGSISSASSTTNAIANQNSFNTAYGLNISSNKLFKARWAAGLRLNAIRSSAGGILERESESVFVGPSISHFFSPATTGSLFLEFSPGYVRFFEASSVRSGTTQLKESVDGNGFGTNLRFGYAHLVSDKILFNFGMNLTNFWIVADRKVEPGLNRSNENLSLSSVAFNFGFSLLLEKFFF